jgi:hypothetical protein
MASVASIVAKMRRAPTNVRFAELSKVCEHYFGPAARQRGSHLQYRTPWQGEPRVNIQDDHGQAKAYQVRQVLQAIDRMETR